MDREVISAERIPAHGVRVVVIIVVRGVAGGQVERPLVHVGLGVALVTAVRRLSVVDVRLRGPTARLLQVERPLVRRTRRVRRRRRHRQRLLHVHLAGAAHLMVLLLLLLMLLVRQRRLAAPSASAAAAAGAPDAAARRLRGRRGRGLVLPPPVWSPPEAAVAEDEAAKGVAGDHDGDSDVEEGHRVAHVVGEQDGADVEDPEEGDHADVDEEDEAQREEVVDVALDVEHGLDVDEGEEEREGDADELGADHAPDGGAVEGQPTELIGPVVPPAHADRQHHDQGGYPEAHGGVERHLAMVNVAELCEHAVYVEGAEEKP